MNDIREDDARGRHTTTRRELVLLPGGGVLIDTPGMRELGLLEDDGGIDTVFADIAEIAQLPVQRLSARERARLRGAGGALLRDAQCRATAELPQAAARDRGR